MKHGVGTELNGISIPSGAIKRMMLTVLTKPFDNISIPSGAIKRFTSLTRAIINLIFQFLLVRLRDLVNGGAS